MKILALLSLMQCLIIIASSQSSSPRESNTKNWTAAIPRYGAPKGEGVDDALYVMSSILRKHDINLITFKNAVPASFEDDMAFALVITTGGTTNDAGPPFHFDFRSSQVLDSFQQHFKIKIAIH